MAQVETTTQGIGAVVGNMLANPSKKVQTSNIRTIDGYEIGNVLGKGGFSEVFLGFDPKNNKRVALKCMFNDPNVKSQEKQIKAELDAMDKIKHKNVVRLYGSNLKGKFTCKDDTTKDTILVVLELATGGELFDYLMYTGKFEEKLARTYFRQLIDGIEACHKAGVAHRDLKPENLLLDSNMVLKLADFGFASVFKDNATGNSRYMQTECGTRAYMAPEILARKKYDHTADIWACGIIAFIMIAGFPPLQQATENDWWFHKLKIKRHNLFWAAHERTAKFSTDAKDFIVSILQAKPSERLTCQGMRQHKWFQGPVYSDTEAAQQLKKLKVKVDQAKKKERMAEQKRSKAHRAVGEELPLEQPGMDDGEVLATLVDGSFGEWGDSPPKFDESTHLASCTEFESEEAPKAVLTRVVQAIKEIQGTVSINQTNYSLEAEVNTQLGLIRLLCEIKEKTDDVSVASFKRVGGNPVNYYKLYQENIVANLLDCVKTDE